MLWCAVHNWFASCIYKPFQAQKRSLSELIGMVFLMQLQHVLNLQLMRIKDLFHHWHSGDISSYTCFAKLNRLGAIELGSPKKRYRTLRLTPHTTHTKQHIVFREQRRRWQQQQQKPSPPSNNNHDGGLCIHKGGLVASLSPYGDCWIAYDLGCQRPIIVWWQGVDDKTDWFVIEWGTRCASPLPPTI